VKVFSSGEAADQEAGRLNQVNHGKKCEYRVYISHLMTEGS
jgi:hypothetical protein